MSLGGVIEYYSHSRTIDGTEAGGWHCKVQRLQPITCYLHEVKGSLEKHTIISADQSLVRTYCTNEWGYVQASSMPLNVLSYAQSGVGR